MKRAPSYLAAIVAAGLVRLAASSSTVGCNELETRDPPDAARPACNAGPFVFDDQGLASLPLPNEQTTNTCSGDNTGQPVIERLPRGGRYGLGWKVQLVGSRDLQGDCEVLTVCTCEVAVTAPPPAPVDAGPDADPDAAAPAPPPATPGAPTWRCL